MKVLLGTGGGAFLGMFVGSHSGQPNYAGAILLAVGAAFCFGALLTLLFSTPSK